MADTENMFSRVAKRQQKTSRPPAPTPEEQPEKPLSKRQSPDYKQVGIYLKKDVHRAVKIKATTEEIEMSQLIEDLLVEWLNK